MRFDVETIHYKIKNGADFETFTDELIKLVGKMPQNDAEQDTIDNIYKAIASCFVYNKLTNSESWQHWICNYCGNRNYNFYVNNKLNTDLSTCFLCGIQQIESIKLRLRNRETFVMTKKVRTIYIAADSNVEQLIKTILDCNIFDLCCPERNDNERCPSMLRLVKQLLYFKKWNSLNTKNDDVYKMLLTNVDKYICDEAFNILFIECAKSIDRINETQLGLLKNMVDINVINKSYFLKPKKKKSFLNIIKEQATILLGPGSELFNKMKNSLINAMRDGFLSDLDIHNIELDYHHILKIHLNNDNKIASENVFNFFSKAVHYDDNQIEIQQCVSSKRTNERIKERYLQPDNKTLVANEQSTQTISGLKQEYIHNRLHIIHYYLVHSQSSTSTVSTECISKMSKYKTHDKYRFGFEHSYPQLSPEKSCIKDELLCNAIAIDEFKVLLIKAIKKQQISQSEKQNTSLICKYFDPAYNIIRNECIGVRHILALVVYTDMSNFCTIFRQTYRMINNETTWQQVTKRHVQLYYYSKSLFESVEFFGEQMDSKMKVYHGLDKLMLFEKFTGYFNQPISTSISFDTAQEFASKESGGIILVLKSGLSYFNDTKTPKYLSVKCFTDFPTEDERLFYGCNVVFQILDIIESNNLTHHSKELNMLNKFQKTLENGKVNWRDGEEETRYMINVLSYLIYSQQNRSNSSHNVHQTQRLIDQRSTTISKYGQHLFDYFCLNQNSSICINNFRLLPDKLLNALFRDRSRYQFSLIPIAKLFPNLKELILCNLELQEMLTKCEKYVNAVLQYIKCSMANIKVKLTKITFMSKKQDFKKYNSSLNQKINSYIQHFDKYGWQAKYQCSQPRNTHNLTFVNKNITDAKLKQQEIEKIIRKSWKVGSSCRIHSTSKKKTFEATIIDIFHDKQGEWLKVQYGSSKKEIQRDHRHIMPSARELHSLASSYRFLLKNKKRESNIIKQTPIMETKTDPSTAYEKESLTYFMQVTSIDEYEFRVIIKRKKLTNTKQILYIKERYEDCNEPCIERILFKKNELSREIGVEIKTNHSALYHLLLYQTKASIDSLPDSNELRFEVLKDDETFPEIDGKYRPQCIDLSTVVKCKDKENNLLKIYWSVPTKSFGEISYCCMDSGTKTETSIDELPYCISLSETPISFNVITVVQDERGAIEDIRESKPSETIVYILK
eukprot:435025_1